MGHRVLGVNDGRARRTPPLHDTGGPVGRAKAREARVLERALLGRMPSGSRIACGIIARGMSHRSREQLTFPPSTRQPSDQNHGSPYLSPDIPILLLPGLRYIRKHRGYPRSWRASRLRNNMASSPNPWKGPTQQSDRSMASSLIRGTGQPWGIYRDSRDSGGACH